MSKIDLDKIFEQQRAFFASGATLPVTFRVQMLKRLYTAVKRYTPQIEEALAADLGKSGYESFMCEIGLVLSEISYMIKNIKRFAGEKRVRTPMSQFASVSYRKPTPYGNVLIMSPWNYPFLLTVDPLVDAIAAGNTAVVKPSAYSPATSEIIAQLIGECFLPEYVTVVTGGRKENEALLQSKFDFIFFTGSQAVGKEVLKRAADNLTPVVLELGGKSPCIIDSTAKIPLASRRIVFGKFLNLGQTCVAPDYILCARSRKEELITELRKQILLQFGEDPLADPDYGRIVNEKHFKRILAMIDEEKVVIGGGADASTLKIAPTVMDNVSFDDAIMGEEIFGPVLPILTYEDDADVLQLLRDRQKPLALYIFSEDRENIRRITERLSFGGGCINDVVVHLATSEMGFGGVGESGMGSYHGRAGFDAFSHTKSILDKRTWIDMPMRYRPYKSRFYERLLHLFLK